MRRRFLAVCLAWALGCARAPAPAAPPTAAAALPSATATAPAVSAASAAAVSGPHLVESQGQLYAVDLPAVFRRSTLLYVLNAQPVPGTQQHERLALVQITEPGPPTKVVPYCALPPNVSAHNLPLENVLPDQVIRVGNCWGRYQPRNERDWRDSDVVDLRLNLGRGDNQLAAGDLFEVLGEAHVEPVSGAVTFDVIAQCAVQPFGADPLACSCRLDRADWPEFDRQAWIRGGFVHRLQVAQ